MAAAFVLVIHNSAIAANRTPENILVLGDSLSAAFGIDKQAGWVALLQEHLQQQGYAYKVINASVSGDTTRTGLNRLEPALQRYSPSIVIVALGGNDGLRGLAFTEIENSLGRIIQRSQHAGARVLLAGVRLPSNYGPAYNRRFAQMYRDIADQYGVPLVPRILDQVGENASLMQSDGIHPTAQAQAQIMQNIWQGLKPLLQQRDISAREQQ